MTILNERIVRSLDYTDRKVRAGTKQIFDLLNPDTYRRVRPTARLALVGIWAIESWFCALFVKQVGPSLLATLEAFPAAAPYLPWRTDLQLLLMVYTVAGVILIGKVGGMIVIGGGRSLKQGL